MNWEKLREEEFEPMLVRTNRVCAVPIGCLEKHGQHLPLGTDTLWGGKLLELASKQEDICIFPQLYFGDLQGMQRYSAGKGTHYGYIALSAELLLSLMRELCDEIGRNGFKKILLFNSHGGNSPFLQNFIRAVNDTQKDYEVFLYNVGLIHPRDILNAIKSEGRSYFPSITDEDISVLQDFIETNKKTGHACFAESALLMGMYPEMIRIDRCEIESGEDTHICSPLTELGIRWGRAWQTDYPNAYEGAPPVGLTQQIADAAVKLAINKTVKVLRLLKDDNIMERILTANNII